MSDPRAIQPPLRPVWPPRATRARRARWIVGVLALLLAWSALGCEIRVEPGRYRCDPAAGGVCPDGWECLPFGTAYECHPTDDHRCGDGVLQPGEQCDGVDNIPGSCEQYGLNPGNLQCTSVCTALCTACGNGAVETGPFGEGEQCDDGNLEARDGCSPECQRERPTWFEQSPPASPPARWGHAMVYDEGRDRVVLFGGSTDATLLDDTWTYDGVTWERVPTTNAPSGRVGHAMAQDAARGVTVLYGGSEALPAAAGLADTWEFDGVDWTLVSTAGSPGDRLGAVAAYEPSRGVTVLFGGVHLGMHQPGTWEFDGEDWQFRLIATAPADRVRPTLVWSPAWQGLVLFGGSRTLAVPVSFGDTWIYRDGHWQDLTTAEAPASREGHAAFYDPLRDRLVLFGGVHQPTGELLTDPWEFDGVAWHPLAPSTTPAARACSAVYHRGLSAALLFGGRTADASATGTGDTWWMQYQAGVGVCGDLIRQADEICDGTDIAPEYGLSCEVLGFGGGELACRADCRLDLAGCYD